MAKVQKTYLLDDIDKTEAEKTLEFSVDGIRYEIDLSTEHLQAFHDTIYPFVEHARKVGRVKTGGVRRTAALSRQLDTEQNKAIREWAKKKGYDVSDKGRIKAEIIDEFFAARGK